jgi:hypothetical protein
MTTRLFVDFCGEERALSPGDSLTFGRSAELCIDDNPYLHRVLGRVVERSGVWWLEHLGRRGTLVVRDVHRPSTSVLAPGATVALNQAEFAVDFTAGPTRYELRGALEEGEWALDLLGPDGLAGTRTLDWGRVELNDDQLLLLLAMCEARLRDPVDVAAPILTSRQGAARLGWSLPKFTRKLDHLCEKLARAGVAGVHGDLGAEAVDRRRLLVEHALAVPLVHVEQLDLLDMAASAA